MIAWLEGASTKCLQTNTELCAAWHTTKSMLRKTVFHRSLTSHRQRRRSQTSRAPNSVCARARGRRRYTRCTKAKISRPFEALWWQRGVRKAPSPPVYCLHARVCVCVCVRKCVRASQSKHFLVFATQYSIRVLCGVVGLWGCGVVWGCVGCVRKWGCVCVYELVITPG